MTQLGVRSAKSRIQVFRSLQVQLIVALIRTSHQILTPDSLFCWSLEPENLFSKFELDNSEKFEISNFQTSDFGLPYESLEEFKVNFLKIWAWTFKQPKYNILI